MSCIEIMPPEKAQVSNDEAVRVSIRPDTFLSRDGYGNFASIHHRGETRHRILSLRAVRILADIFHDTSCTFQSGVPVWLSARLLGCRPFLFPPIPRLSRQRIIFPPIIFTKSAFSTKCFSGNNRKKYEIYLTCS